MLTKLRKQINWPALAHLAMIGASAWIAARPQYAWVIPVLQAAGGFTPPPVVTSGGEAKP